MTWFFTHLQQLYSRVKKRRRLGGGGLQRGKKGSRDFRGSRLADSGVLIGELYYSLVCRNLFLEKETCTKEEKV